MQYFYAEYKIFFQKHLEELAAHGLLNNLQQLVRDIYVLRREFMSSELCLASQMLKSHDHGLVTGILNFCFTA